MDKFQFAYPESTWNGIVYSVDKALYMTGYQDGTIKKGILNSDLILYDGVLTLNETNTPVASDGYGKIYTKSDNELYFQDGAGTEHSVIVDNGGAIDDIFYENAQDVTADYTVAATRNAMSAGPITIASGVTVTLSSGATWTIV